MGRKKSAPSKTSKSNDDSFDEEAAREIYRKRSYQPPENKGLETVLELPEETLEADCSRSRATKGKLIPKMRMLTTQPYHIQDKDKDSLRRKQASKLFKGRKKPKWQGLTAQQESALLEAIASKSDSDEDETEEKHLIPFIIADSPPLRLSEDSSPNEESLASKTDEIEYEEVFQTDILQKSAEKSPDQSNLSRLASTSVSSSTDDEKFASVIDKVVASITMTEKLSKEEMESIEEADKYLGLIGFDDSEKVAANHPKNDARQDSIIKADAFLGPLGFEDDDSNFCKHNMIINKENIKSKRESKIANVRRSSRFFAPLAEKQPSSCLGSIYTDVEVKDRPTRRRSKLLVRPNLQILEKRASSPIEEALKLITSNEQPIRF